MATRYRPGGVKVRIGRSQDVFVPPRVFRGRATCMHFDTDKSFLLPSSISGIRNIVAFFHRHPGMAMLVNGHTDLVGSPQYNVRLSNERTAAVTAYLLNHPDEWLAWYSAPIQSKRWSYTEDQHMLATVVDPSGKPYYAGPITGRNDAATQDAAGRFQFDNGLEIDQQLGPITRRALITRYMELEGTSLPGNTPIVQHGCGEFHPVDDTPGADAGNRRVEIFLFDGPVDPPPQDPCPSPGCTQYHDWVGNPEEDIDLCQPQEFDLVVVVEDDATPPRPVALANVELSGATPGRGITGDDGIISFLSVDPDTYLLTAAKKGFDTVTKVVDVPGPPQLAKSSLVGGPAAGERSTPAPGGATVATVQLALTPPTIVSFEVSALPATPKDPAASPGPRARVHPGQLITLAWEVSGPFETLTLEPGAIDLKPVTKDGKGTINGLPIDIPPDDDGVYKLTANNASGTATATVEVLGLLQFSVVADPGGSLFLPDGTTQVDELPGVEGSLDDLLAADRTRPNRPSFVGQITVHAGATFRWVTAGTNKLTLQFRSISAAGDSRSIDVTGQTSHDVPDKPPTPDPGGLGKATFLQADLHVREAGTQLQSSVIRLRENRPFPALLDFFLTRAGKPIGEGEEIPDWKGVEAHWKLGGDFDLNTLSLKISDAHTGVFTDTLRKPGARPFQANGSKPEDPPASGVALTGAITAVADLEPAGSRLVRHLAVTEPAPKPPVVTPAPPRALEVGFNYAWAFNKYGLQFGPGGCARTSPGAAPAGWIGMVPATLKQLADMRCTVVRWFILCNGNNYGPAPVRRTIKIRGKVVSLPIEDFTPPATLDPSFITDFVELLKIFKAFNDDPQHEQKLRLLPSFVDFGMFADSSSGGGGGRYDLVNDPAKRTHFLDTVLNPFLSASLPFRDHLLAWEVINEPSWNVRLISPPTAIRVPVPRLPFPIPVPRPTVSLDNMRAFIREALKRIEVSFQSTVGHRFQQDLLDYPTGQLPQFHYYAQVFGSLPIIGDLADPAEVPQASVAPANRFVGEIGSLFSPPRIHGNPWPELKGADVPIADRLFERLTRIEAKKYKLCLVWPDLDDPTGTGLLKLSADSQKSLVRFTGGVATGVAAPL